MADDPQGQAARLAKVERLLATLRSGRDGRDGRDGADGEPGPAGERGERGEPGRDGKSVDLKAVEELIRLAADERFAALQPPKDGRDGRDASQQDIATAVSLHAIAYPAPAGKDGAPGERGAPGLRGHKGDRGPQGERGPRGETGPRPDHEWDGTKLRLELPDGDWGKYVDLRGPRGHPGPPAIGGGNGEVVAPPFDLDTLPNGDPVITPSHVVVKQAGVWVKLSWGAFIDFLPQGPSSGDRWADDWADDWTAN